MDENQNVDALEAARAHATDGRRKIVKKLAKCVLVQVYPKRLTAIQSRIEAIDRALQDEREIARREA